MITKKQYFGMKYPFTNNCLEKYEFDLNASEKDRVASDILHLIFTPKGQRLRLPGFGTDLVAYIFEPNDGSTWEGVKKEIRSSVSRWIYGVELNDIQVVASDDGDQIYVRVDYTVNRGNLYYKNSIAVEI